MTTIGIFRNDENAMILEPGQVIFKDSDPGDVMYVILEGNVNIIHNGNIIDTLGEGQIFGEMALIDDSPRSADAIAATKSKIVPVNKKRFSSAIQLNPYFALQVMSIMADRLRNLMQA